jgi:hypothetical protein
MLDVKKQELKEVWLLRATAGEAQAGACGARGRGRMLTRRTLRSRHPGAAGAGEHYAPQGTPA